MTTNCIQCWITFPCFLLPGSLWSEVVIPVRLTSMDQINMLENDQVWFDLVLWHIKHCKLFNAKPILYIWTVLFQTVQFKLSTQFECQKQFYHKLFSFVNKVKWLQVLLCTTNNSIKHQSGRCSCGVMV